MDRYEAVADGAIHTIRTAHDVYAQGVLIHTIVTAHMLCEDAAYDSAARVLAAWAEVTRIDRPAPDVNAARRLIEGGEDR